MLLASPHSLHAAERLKISPVRIETTAVAGERVTETITATASGDEAIVVELVHMDFGFSDDTYDVVLIDDEAHETTAFSTRGWFSLHKPRYRIPAGESRDLQLRIDVPPNQPGGTHLGAAIIRVVQPEQDDTDSRVRAVQQAGPLVFIAVHGGKPPKPRIDSFDAPGLTKGGPIRPELVVANDGDEFFTIEGEITLRGRGVDDELSVRNQMVVPDHPRNVHGIAEDSDEAPLKLGSSSLAIGRYEVSTELRIEPTGTKLSTTRTVWIIPTWARVLALLSVAALVGAIAFGIRRRRAR